jgi:hypothetical protein
MACESCAYDALSLTTAELTDYATGNGLVESTDDNRYFEVAS